MKYLIVSLCLAGFAFADTGTISNKNEPSRRTTWTLDSDGGFHYKGAVRDRRWIWDGEKLTPERDSNDKRSTFVWDGETLEPMRDDEDHNTVEWNGTEFMIRDRNFEPRRFLVKDGEWIPVHGSRSDHTWLVEGELPLPLIAFVMFDLANSEERE